MTTPTIIVEINFATSGYDGLVGYFDSAKFNGSGFAPSTTPPLAGPTSVILDDASRGLLDTGTLASDSSTGDWVDVTTFVRSVATRRGRNRILDRWGAGSCSIVFDNTDRRFDPTNSLSPYYAGGRSRVEPMRQVRVRALWNNTYYPLFLGYIDSWDIDYTMDGDSTAAIVATDGFKLLNGYEVPDTAYSGTQTTGARIDDMLTLAQWSTDPANRSIATGNTTINKRNVAGAVLDEILATVTTEIGEFWMARDGVPTFRRRRARWEDLRSLASQLLFGDRLSATPLPATTSTGVPAAITLQGTATQTADGIVCDSNGYATTPAATNLDLTGEVEMVVRVSATDWTPAADQIIVAKANSGASANYMLYLSSTGPGRLIFVTNETAGGGQRSFFSSVSPSFTDGQTYWIKVTFQRDNGSNSVVNFYTATDQLNEPGGWTQLGASVTAARVTTTLLTNSLTLAIGAYSNGSSKFVGAIKRVILRNGIAGTKVFDAELVPEMPYADISLPSTDDLLVNRMSAQSVGGTVQTYEDAASISRYLPRAASVSGLLHTTDAESAAYASLNVGLFKQPDVRFESLGLNPQRDIRLWDPLLAREIGDKVTIRRRPPGGGAVIERDCWIEGIAHDMDKDGTWLTKLQLSDATTAPVATTNYAVADTALAGY